MDKQDNFSILMPAKIPESYSGSNLPPRNSKIMKQKISRNQFLVQMGLMGTSALLFNSCDFSSSKIADTAPVIGFPEEKEGIFDYIKRQNGKLDQTLYRQIIGSANEFKEGDLTLSIAAESETSRQNARLLLANTSLADLKTIRSYR